MLRGILGDPICEAGVVLDEHEAAVCMVFLPGSVEHLGLDLVMLGTGLAPRGVKWLVEILDKVGRLAQGKGHLIQAPSEAKHFFSVCRESLERVRSPSPRRRRRPA